MQIEDPDDNTLHCLLDEDDRVGYTRLSCAPATPSWRARSVPRAGHRGTREGPARAEPAAGENTEVVHLAMPATIQEAATH